MPFLLCLSFLVSILLYLFQSFSFLGSSMEEPSVTRDFAWTESSGSDASAEPFTDDSDRSS